MFDKASYWVKRSYVRLDQAIRQVQEAYEFLETPELQTGEIEKAYNEIQEKLRSFGELIEKTDISKAVAEAEALKKLQKGGEKNGTSKQV